MKLTVTKLDSKAAGDITVGERTFAADFNEPLVHRVVVAYLAGGRAGTRGHKSRSTARGGGAKPWRQKGTGRARAGTIRSPLWRGGGKTFAVAAPQDHSQKVNRREYGAALRAILSELVRQERLLVTEDFAMEKPATGELCGKLRGLGVDHNALLVSAGHNQNLHLSARNIPGIHVATAAAVNPVQLVRHEKVVFTVDAVKAMEERLQ
ncbi:MAG: 50S ribosomal protein L4 [Gammaproteobacteria bacterium]|nr:50S ribosomal protein L4 [Gammaproteobacteria bacterium]